MTQELLDTVKKTLSTVSIYTLFTDTIGMPEDVENEDDNKYALMFNHEKNECFFLDYAVFGNGWDETAEGQNPWMLLGYISATDILMNDPKGEIIDLLQEKIDIKESYERELKNRN